MIETSYNYTDLWPPKNNNKLKNAFPEFLRNQLKSLRDIPQKSAYTCLNASRLFSCCCFCGCFVRCYHGF